MPYTFPNDVTVTLPSGDKFTTQPGLPEILAAIRDLEARVAALEAK